MKLNKVIAVSAMLFIGSLAHADNDALKYERLTSLAKIKIDQAISKAQLEASGIAVNVELESKLGSVVYEVDVLSKGRMFEVFVDASSGNVIKVREDLD